MGAAYEFTRCASANLRQRDDAWNSFWGGLAGGSMLGLRCMPILTPIDPPTQSLSSIQSAPLPPSPVTEPLSQLSSAPGNTPVVRSPVTTLIPQSTKWPEKNTCARTEGDQWRRRSSRLARDAVWKSCFYNKRPHTDNFRHLRTRIPGEKSRETPAKLWHRGASCFFLDFQRS
jgi:hypothetical protein